MTNPANRAGHGGHAAAPPIDQDLDFRRIADELGVKPDGLTREALYSKIREMGHGFLEQYEADHNVLPEMRNQTAHWVRDAWRGERTNNLYELSNKQLLTALAQRGLDGVPLRLARYVIADFDRDYPDYMLVFRLDCKVFGLNPDTATKADLDRVWDKARAKAQPPKPHP